MELRKTRVTHQTGRCSLRDSINGSLSHEIQEAEVGILCLQIIAAVELLGDLILKEVKKEPLSFCRVDDAGLDRFWLYRPRNPVTFINKVFELLLYACVLMSFYYTCMFDLC